MRIRKIIRAYDRRRERIHKDYDKPKKEISWESYWATLISATVEDADPDAIVLTFPSARTSLTDTDFTVTVNGGAVAVSSASWAGDVLTLDLASDCVYGDVVVVTFVRTGGTANVTNNIAPEAELTTYITGLTTPLSEEQKIRINKIIKGLKTGWSVSNLSDVDDIQYVLAGETAESSLKNLVKNAHHATAVNAPTFTAFEGFKGDGISSYIDTNYNPSTQGINYKLNNASLCIYSRTELNGAVISVGVGNITGAKLVSLILRSSNTMQVRINEPGTGSVVNNLSQGMFHGVRLVSTKNKSYRNKTHLGDLSKTTNSIPSGDIFICCQNLDGTPTNLSSRQYSWCSIGKGKDATNINSETDVIEAYMDSNGKGVIA